MTDLERAEAALIAADKAGDTAGAAALAQHVRDLRAGLSKPSGSAGQGGAGGSTGQVVATRPEGSMSGAAAIPGRPAGEQIIPSDATTGTGMLTGDESAAERARLGLAGAGINAYLGTKNLLGPLSKEERNVLRQANDDVARSGTAGKIANFAGQVGTGVASAIAASAVPIPAAVARVVGGATPFVKGLFNYGKNAGASAGTEFVMAPAEDQTEPLISKAKQAGKAALFGMGLKGAADVAQVPVRGLFTATKDARDLMAQGVNPTLQQAAESPIGRWVGGLTTGATKVAERQGQEMKAALADRASGGQVSTSREMTLNELNDMLGASAQRDMDALFQGKRIPMNQSIRNDVLQQADNLKKSGGRGLLQQNQARKELDNIIGTDTNAVRMGNRTFQADYLDPINNSISAARDPRVLEALQNAKAVLEARAQRAPLNAEEKAALDQINGRMYDIARMREAAGPAGETTGFNVKKVVKAYGDQPDAALNTTNLELIGPMARTLERSPNQDQARGLLIAARRAIGPIAAAGITGHLPALAPLYLTSLAGQTATGARFLTGQTGWQKNLTSKFDSEEMQRLADLLRNQGASFVGN